MEAEKEIEKGIEGEMEYRPGMRNVPMGIKLIYPKTVLPSYSDISKKYDTLIEKYNIDSGKIYNLITGESTVLKGLNVAAKNILDKGVFGESNAKGKYSREQRVEA